MQRGKLASLAQKLKPDIIYLAKGIAAVTLDECSSRKTRYSLIAGTILALHLIEQVSPASVEIARQICIELEDTEVGD